MERRSFVGTAALGVATLIVPRLATAGRVAHETVAGAMLYVNPVTGDDTKAGSQSAPLRTLAEAARRVSRDSGRGSLTVIMTEGIHAIAETALFSPSPGRFSKDERLVIRAEVLPDDAAWDHGRMPTLIHTLPVKDTWNGRPDPLGGAADGMLIETSHVTIQGLRILGMPVVESPRAGTIKRLYAVSRLRPELDDLEITQCVFVGDEIVAPNHVGIIALGNGLVVHHCIFRGLKISAVYWGGGTTGHAMHHCVNEDLYGSAVWTAGVANDFTYHHNVVARCNYVWTHQDARSAGADAGAAGAAAKAPRIPSRYQVVDSHFADNRRLAGSGTGARLEYHDIDASFLEMVRTDSTAQGYASEHDQEKRTYLHPVQGSAAAATGAGLFITRGA
jgi:hypothetical protein